MSHRDPAASKAAISGASTLAIRSNVSGALWRRFAPLARGAVKPEAAAQDPGDLELQLAGKRQNFALLFLDEIGAKLGMLSACKAIT